MSKIFKIFFLLEFLLIFFLVIFSVHLQKTEMSVKIFEIDRSKFSSNLDDCHLKNKIISLNLAIMEKSKVCGWISKKSKIQMYQSFKFLSRTVSVAVHINLKAPDKAVIHITGGPAGSIGFHHDVNNEPLLELLSKNYKFVYNIGYSGTRFNVITDNDGQMDMTDLEITVIAKEIINSIGKVPDLVGVSMGAPIASSAFFHSASKKMNLFSNLKLLSPLICSPAEIIKFFNQSFTTADNQKVKKVEVVVVDRQSGRVQQNTALDPRFLIQKFFGPANINNDLAYYLDKLPIKPKIVMGSLDKKIYCGDEAYLKAFTAKYPTTIIPGMDHVPANWDQLNQITKAIE